MGTKITAKQKDAMLHSLCKRSLLAFYGDEELYSQTLSIAKDLEKDRYITITYKMKGFDAMITPEGKAFIKTGGYKRNYKIEKYEKRKLAFNSYKKKIIIALLITFLAYLLSLLKPFLISLLNTVPN